MTPELMISLREFDRRQIDGVDVRLLWCAADGSVLVAVDDHQTGQVFSVEVQEGDRAGGVQPPLCLRGVATSKMIEAV